MRWGVAATVGVGLIVLLFLWWSPTTEGPPPGVGLTSVAVLPLRNMSADPEDSDYLADGITEAVIHRLTRVGLRVTPWDTARRYADRSEQGKIWLVS